MIAIIICFYGGGITITEAEAMSLSRLDRYLIKAVEISETQKKVVKNGF